MRKNKEKAIFRLLMGSVCFILVMMCVFAAGCEKNNLPTHESESYSTNISIIETTESETTVDTLAEEDFTEVLLPTQEEIIYKGAVKDFLPIEEYSWARLYSPDMVMIHFTSAVVTHPEAPYDITYIRNLFINYEVSIHYIIERNGTVRCYIPENRVAWHAGKGEFIADSKYTDAMNQYAIGIELVGMGSKSDMSGYMSGEKYDALDDSLKCFTDEQYSSLKALVDDICLRYGIPLDREHIIGHEEYALKKRDPGELFMWDRIIPPKK